MSDSKLNKQWLISFADKLSNENMIKKFTFGRWIRAYFTWAFSFCITSVTFEKWCCFQNGIHQTRSDCGSSWFYDGKIIRHQNKSTTINQEYSPELSFHDKWTAYWTFFTGFTTIRILSFTTFLVFWTIITTRVRSICWRTRWITFESCFQIARETIHQSSTNIESTRF